MNVTVNECDRRRSRSAGRMASKLLNPCGVDMVMAVEVRSPVEVGPASRWSDSYINLVRERALWCRVYKHFVVVVEQRVRHTRVMGSLTFSDRGIEFGEREESKQGSIIVEAVPAIIRVNTRHNRSFQRH